MRDLSGPALVEGRAEGSVIFKEITSGQETIVTPDAATMQFRSMLPEGKYIVKYNGEEQLQTLLPASTCYLDLRPGKALNYEITSNTTNKGDIVIKVIAQGTGIHHFTIRTDNLTLINTAKELVLQTGKTGTTEWHARISSPGTAWVVLVIPDGDMQQRKELTGAAWKK